LVNLNELAGCGGVRLGHHACLSELVLPRVTWGPQERTPKPDQGEAAVRLGKTLLALVGATVLLCALGTAASARNLSINNQNLRASWREARFSGAFGNTVCPLTIEGSFHTRTLAKVVGALTGLVTRAIVGACSVGSATLLTETLPWHSRYQSFTGTLPNITGLTAHVIDVAMRVREPGGILCLSRSNATEPVVIRANREVITGALTNAEITGAIRTDCFEAVGTFASDRGPVSVLGSTSRLTVTLI